MPLDSDAQAVSDQYAKFNAPPIETLSPENARNNPILKNAVEQMAVESATVRSATRPSSCSFNFFNSSSARLRSVMSSMIASM